MVRIQLENGYLEVKEGSDFPLNFGVAEIRDLSARQGTFSKSIKLTGSDNNNQLLNHYYDVNIEQGTFDINALTTCAVIQNGLPILEDCYLQLVSVDKVQNSDGHDEGVEYTVVIKDAQADFFTVLDNSELTDIDLTDLNHTYNSTNVQGSFSNTVIDGYMYPLLFTPDDQTQLTDYVPAVYAKVYWDRIHASNGFSYTWSTLSDELFDKLIIPYNGDRPELDYSTYEVNAEKSSFTVGTGTPIELGDAITSWTENVDDESLFNPTTGVYEPPFYVGVGSAVNFQFEVDFDVELVNGTGANAYLVDELASGSTQGIYYRPKVHVYKNGSLYGAGYVNLNLATEANFLTTDNPLANGTTTLLSNLTGTIDVPANNLLPTDDLTVVLTVEKQAYGSTLVSFMDWKDANSLSGTSVTVTEQIVVNSIEMTANLSVQQLGFGQTVDVNNYIPRKIKQKDFVKSICMMYNLIVEPDKDNPNKLVYKVRDDYYDDGETKNWTAKLRKEVPQNLEFLPDLSKKKLLMTYKQDKDESNVLYEDATNEVYGQVEYTYTNEYVKGVDKKELIFSPTPMVWNSFGAVVPAINAASPKTNIRILIHNGTKGCNAFDIIDYGTTGTSSTTYPMVSHFDDHFNPTFDINFAPCDYYFYNPIFALTNNNLFNQYWRRTIAQVNSGKMLTAYFDLGEGDIQKLKLSDKIRIDNSYWNINRVIDYNPNKQQFTKVELLSVDEEIDLDRFITKPLIPDVGLIGGNATGVLIDNYYTNNNINSAGSIVKGVGNVIENGVKAVVVGNNQRVTSSGVWVDGKQVVDASSPTQLKTGYAPIGSWDMQADAFKTGIPLPIPRGASILTVNVTIIADIGNPVVPLVSSEGAGSWRLNTSGFIVLIRATPSIFIDVAYNDTTINRGWITYTYIE